jgi:hypothetical protein
VTVQSIVVRDFSGWRAGLQREKPEATVLDEELEQSILKLEQFARSVSRFA